MGPHHFIYMKTHFFTLGHIRFSGLCGPKGVGSVDQKVNTC